MGRKERHDVDYFPFFIKDGRTLFILEGKYQCKGTGFFTNLFRFLSRTPDHHFQIQNEADQLYFFASVKCDEESALDMIEIMVKTGKLDRDLWEQKKVLGSQDYLDSIQEAYRKRENPCITLESIKEFYGITSGRNTQAKGKPAEEIQPQRKTDPITSPDNPQRKEKERKEKKRKEVLSDEDWLKTLEDNPTYDGLEVRVLYGKMCVWCENNGKQPTRRRFVNWLNREDKPLRSPAQERPHYVTI